MNFINLNRKLERKQRYNNIIRRKRNNEHGETRIGRQR